MNFLNFGSLNIDMVYDVDHFVMAGETLSSLHMEKHCGGKGLNQSVALAKAGACVFHAGMVGADGDMLIKRMQEGGVDVSHVQVCDEPSGHAIIQVDARGQNCILLYGGANQKIDQAMVDRVLAGFAAGDVLLLQNEISSLSYIIQAAHAKGLRIALNPSPYNAGIEQCDLSCIDFFLLNEVEGEQITGKTQPDEILQAMRERFPRAAIVLTLGRRGAVYDDGIVRCAHNIYDVPVVDTTAAGDTFTGFFLASIGRGDSPLHALELASKASALAVSVKGASNSIPNLADVEQAKLTLAADD